MPEKDEQNQLAELLTKLEAKLKRLEQRYLRLKEENQKLREKLSILRLTQQEPHKDTPNKENAEVEIESLF